MALAPIFIAGIISYFLYSTQQRTTAFIIAIILVILAVWLGLIIFKRVRLSGLIDFMTAVNATPDLDNLEPTEDSNTKKRPKNLFSI